MIQPFSNLFFTFHGTAMGAHNSNLVTHLL